ncbi:hypothetical protein GCM10022214_74760 [Actinomadura miaoliensis]|uniref:Transposase n=1 Tax=Actinomadura miaoliensis TaxID=430685 RepID=A0ABP7WX24_9ACTN
MHIASGEWDAENTVPDRPDGESLFRPAHSFVRLTRKRSPCHRRTPVSAWAVLSVTSALLAVDRLAYRTEEFRWVC